MDRKTDNSPSALSDLVFGIADGFARLAATPKVYPAYIASRIKSTLLLDDPRAPRPNEHIIESVGEIETLGSCRYATTVIDHNGSTYRVTVELVAPAKAVR